MLKVKNISKSFKEINFKTLFLINPLKEKSVLEDISFEVENGQILLIKGSNGSGKTTLLRIISGLLTPNLGSVYLDQKSILPSDISFTNNNERSFFWRLSVIENLLFFGKLYKGLNHKNKEVDSLLDFFGLNELRNNRYMTLSSGEKQKVNLCRTFLKNSRVMLFDEITNSLDQDSKELLFKRLNQERSQDPNKIILWVTHDLSELNELSPEIFKIDKINNDNSLNNHAS